MLRERVNQEHARIHKAFRLLPLRGIAFEATGLASEGICVSFLIGASLPTAGAVSQVMALVNGRRVLKDFNSTGATQQASASNHIEVA